jgi:hypothetical protein
MRRVQQSLDWALLPVYERIVECYCPYVLVRCARYTNNRRQAQQIGAYTLVSACLVARELGDIVPIGRIVERQVRVVGPDVLRGARGEDWRQGLDEPLLVDPWMRHMAMALNAQKRRGREVLVLHHVGGIGLEDLARLVEQPAEEVQPGSGGPRRWLVAGRAGRAAGGWPLRGRLDRWMRAVAACAMEYLVGCATNGDSSEPGTRAETEQEAPDGANLRLHQGYDSAVNDESNRSPCPPW